MATPEYNISGGERDEYAAFAVDNYGDISRWDEAVAEQEAGHCRIVAKLLDAPMFPGGHDEWLASVKERWVAIKPRRGRPTGSGEGRTGRVEWSTTPERKERVRAMAEAAGLSVAAWLDALVDKAKR